MYLKSLTLKGFKSFASSTTLQLEPGITCIVGPNGSGKSNVVDALAWVMGEQGAKSLRGGKMEDVIFAGTSGRPPLGRAEVLLTIDNSDGALPIEYAEVTISRTMFRSGGSEYAINGQPCRLLDVQELLSDSGIGREMHVIVGQGQLDTILHATPGGPARLHRGGRRRPQAPQAQGEGAPQARLHRGQPDPAQRPAQRDPPPAQAARPAGRGRPQGRRRPGRRPRRAGPADGRRPGPGAHRAGAGAGRRDDPGRAPRAEVEAAVAKAREAEAALEAALREDLPALSRRRRRPGSRCAGCASGCAAPSHWPPSGSATPAPSRTRSTAGRDPEQLEAEAERVREPGAGDQRRGRAPARRHSRRPSPARKAAEDAAAEEERRVAGLQRAAADRREGWPGCTARSTRCVPRRRRRRRGRPAHARPARRHSRPRRARPARLHRARDPGRRPGRRRGGARRRARSRRSRPSTTSSERLAKTRDEVQQAERDRAIAAGPQGRPRDGPQPQGRRRRPAGRLRLRLRAARLGRRAARRCAPATRPPSPAALGSAADAVAVRDADAAVDAIGHLKTDDLGRAGMLLGGGPGRRPRLARPARPRDVRRRRGGLPGRPARGAGPARCSRSPSSTTSPPRGRWCASCPTSPP